MGDWAAESTGRSRRVERNGKRARYPVQKRTLAGWLGGPLFFTGQVNTSPELKSSVVNVNMEQNHKRVSRDLERGKKNKTRNDD